MRAPQSQQKAHAEHHQGKLVGGTASKTAARKSKKAPLTGVEKWLRKLHDPVSNVTWKKLRNDYARLLRHNLSLGATSPPFDRAPDDGPLRNLLPDEKARFRGDGFGFGDAAKKKRNASSSSKTLFDAETKTKTMTKTKTTTNGDERAVSTTSYDYDGILDESSAETALRDLLRRADVAGAPRELGAAEIAVAVPPPLQGLFENENANPFADIDRVSLKDDERKDSVISREMRAFIAAEGVDGGIGNKNAPVADVVAALGAEREKCKELEWRLRRAETALETCRRELNETRLAAVATLRGLGRVGGRRPPPQPVQGESRHARRFLGLARPHLVFL